MVAPLINAISCITFNFDFLRLFSQFKQNKMDNINTSFKEEVRAGQRFEFGKNWKNFSSYLNAEKISESEKALLYFLGDIKGKTFADIGSGSGLSSLAARNLGAKVFSMDYDPYSVFCAQSLKDRFFPSDNNWDIVQASVLDEKFLSNLGKFDIAYSWGVLHHTGKMWEALNNVDLLVSPKGLLFVSLYNHEDFYSNYWTMVKKAYNSNKLGKILVSLVHIPYFFTRTALKGIIVNRNPISEFSRYKKQRGMNLWHDWIDWLGGYPFETATPEQVVEFYNNKGYTLKKLKTTNSLGCNEFVFQKSQ